MTLNNDQKKMAIFIVAALFCGIVIGAMMSHYEKREMIAYSVYKIDMIKSCETGCYLSIEEILEGSETVEGTFPNMFNDCKYKCYKQYGT